MAEARLTVASNLFRADSCTSQLDDMFCLIGCPSQMRYFATLHQIIPAITFEEFDKLMMKD